ncbi:RNA-binding domain-containing protein [Phlegmacium glaucopus]|nr:RNA-binding domain-containing protein [Phlegmacium glaucopus]
MSNAQAAPVTENGVPSVSLEETPSFKVFAGNLAYTTTDEGLKAFFAPVQSDILTAQVILRGTRSAGYGFVALATAEAAQKAVQVLDKTELDGRQVIVEIAKPSEQKDKEKKEKKSKRRPGRRGGKAVPGEVSEAEANGEAPKAEDAEAPESDDAAKPKKKKKKSARRGKKADADGADVGPAPAAPASSLPEGEATEGPKKTRIRKPRTPRPPRPAGEDPAGEPSKSVLFVANLGFTVDDAGLSALFTEAGIQVVNARIVRRRWGQPRKSKGYGFVDVGSEEEQKKAIAALEGKDIGGRPIAVKIAVNPSHDESAANETTEDGAAGPGATDDYLSNKFLPDEHESSSKPTTYSQLRKAAQRKAQSKNEQNRIKSRRQREIESREEGLSKSLFERAKEEEDAGMSSGNKALSIMMKMGFKPGQALGNNDHLANDIQNSPLGSPLKNNAEGGGPQGIGFTSDTPTVSETLPVMNIHTKHKTEPLPLNEWTGRQGIGLGKRARSPSAAERLAKMAKMAEDMDHRDFRERARDDYNNRRAEGRLAPAQLTCATLDEQMEKSFNVLWLNPNNPNTFPRGLMDALSAHNSSNIGIIPNETGESVQSRLRKQMQADALQPVDHEESTTNKKSFIPAEDQYSPEVLEEATQFLRLQAQDRLYLVLSYLRDKHAYCFWCGVKYESEGEIQSQCPGPDEDDHD